jgi:hypothetical protein
MTIGSRRSPSSNFNGGRIPSQVNRSHAVSLRTIVTMTSLEPKAMRTTPPLTPHLSAHTEVFYQVATVRVRIRIRMPRGLKIMRTLPLPLGSVLPVVVLLSIYFQRLRQKILIPPFIHGLRLLVFVTPSKSTDPLAKAKTILKFIPKIEIAFVLI